MQFTYHSRRLLFFNQNSPSRDPHCPEVVRITDKEIRLLARRAPHCSGLESDSKVGVASQRASFRVNSLILATRIQATALSIEASKSLARRRHRPIQARVRSTTQRRLTRTKPLASSARLTISIDQSPSRRKVSRSLSPA